MLNILKSGSDPSLMKDINCDKFQQIINAQDKLTKQRALMYKLVNVKKICPESEKENTKGNHRKKIQESAERAKKLKEIKKLGC